MDPTVTLVMLKEVEDKGAFRGARTKRVVDVPWSEFRRSR
jgi:hypothetical protein